ncbi:MAG: hypothetical protein R2710_20665 [Acidimicrobiales bacterium]
MQWNVPKALASLGGISVALVVGVGAFGAANIKDATSLDRYREATVSAGVTDMMHDAIRSDVLDGLLTADTEAALANVDEHKSTMLGELDAIEVSLADSPEVQQYVSNTRPVLEEYVAAASATIEAVVTGPGTVDARLSVFTKQFEALETELAGLSEAVVVAGQVAEADNHAATESTRQLLIVATLIAAAVMAGAAR